MGMNNINTLASELAVIALEKKQLALKEETIKNQLILEMKKVGTQKESFDFGSVSVGVRKSYTYSPVVTKLQEKLKIKMDDEVKQGVAEVKETEFITFREVKHA
jgi:hypothetical protein